MTHLIEHLESFLGEMSGGSSGDGTTPPGVQVAWFPNAPFDEKLERHWRTPSSPRIRT